DGSGLGFAVAVGERLRLAGHGSEAFHASAAKELYVLGYKLLSTGEAIRYSKEE
ncbi:unnamed protein product, partial [Amoebophrya sp. A120]